MKLQPCSVTSVRYNIIIYKGGEMKKDKMQPGRGEVVIYKTSDKRIRLEVKLEKETVWLSQKQMADLFSRDVRTINEHIKNIFKEGELSEKTVIRKFRTTAADGKSYDTQFYNLDVIISVGYRVKSQQGTQFRIWATSVLRQHIIKGFTLNKNRLRDSGLQDLEKTVSLFKATIESRQLNSDETQGLLKLIADYATSWVLFQRYDMDELEAKGAKRACSLISHEEALAAIVAMKRDIAQKDTGELFGVDRQGMLSGILAGIGQSFDGADLYPTIEEKAAHLLYFVIKDHPFIDGNKRIGSLLFLHMLARNRYLFTKAGKPKFNDNALVALALLIAESRPKQKDIMVRLVMNFLYE